MKKEFLYSLANNAMTVITFVVATKAVEYNPILGIITWIIAFISLDLHSYVDKKLNYPNNIFIKS